MREGQFRNLSGCAISGIISRTGNTFSGKLIVDSIAVMRERSNGLGGGFAAYGIYPDKKDFYAFHIFYDHKTAKKECEEFLEEHFEIVNCSLIPTRQIPEIFNEPMIWRYFLDPRKDKIKASRQTEREFVKSCVFKINAAISGAYVFSSGKNMGVFKAVGYPEDVGRYYCLEDYEGFCWTAHGRYPTNTPGWWGGAHPFSLLDLSVVHNGEISSYDANRRAIEQYGYKCALLTDTEAITYIIDYLHTIKGLTLEEVSTVIAAPFWSAIGQRPPEERARLEFLRYSFASQLITGPFSIIVGFDGGLMALNDRLKLRSMVAGEKGDMVYVASEEAAIRVIQSDLDRVWSPKGGEPVLVTVNKGSV